MESSRKIPWNKGKKGLQTSFWKGKTLSVEHKTKLREAHKGKKMHEKTREGLRRSLIGNQHTLGKKMPESFCEKISKRLIGNKINVGRVLTTEHKNKISRKLSGSKSPFWKGGITPINQKIRSSRIYNSWEKLVKEKNDYKCQKCKSGVKKDLVAHHILNFAEYPELRFSVENGITFCRSKCHKLFHHIYGRKKNNLSQLIEFLEEDN